jgi:hypothetical protein
MNLRAIAVGAVWATLVGCSSAETPAPPGDVGHVERTEFAAGEIAQKIGVTRWVLRDMGGHGELSGFDSTGQERAIVHALFAADPRGGATIDFDLPEEWHASVSQAGAAPLPPPASAAIAVVALISSLHDLQAAPPPSSSLVTESMGGSLHTLVTAGDTGQTPPTPEQAAAEERRNTALVHCMSVLLPSAKTYEEVESAFSTSYLSCLDLGDNQKYVGGRYVGSRLYDLFGDTFLTQVGTTCRDAWDQLQTCTQYANGTH